jgi:hypothetical protein
MIMASVRPASRSNEEVQVAVPTVSSYLHKVMSLVARQLFAYPSLIRKPHTETEADASTKAVQIKAIIMDAVQGAVTDLTPHDTIMDNYLDETLNSHTVGSNIEAKSPFPLVDIKTVEVQQQPVQYVKRDDLGFPIKTDEIEQSVSWSGETSDDDGDATEDSSSSDEDSDDSNDAGESSSE